MTNYSNEYILHRKKEKKKTESEKRRRRSKKKGIKSSHKDTILGKCYNSGSNGQNLNGTQLLKSNGGGMKSLLLFLLRLLTFFFIHNFFFYFNYLNFFLRESFIESHIIRKLFGGKIHRKSVPFIILLHLAS